jgi:hypothetical protein
MAGEDEEGSRGAELVGEDHDVGKSKKMKARY